MRYSFDRRWCLHEYFSTWNIHKFFPISACQQNQNCLYSICPLCRTTVCVLLMTSDIFFHLFVQHNNNKKGLSQSGYSLFIVLKNVTILFLYRCHISDALFRHLHWSLCLKNLTVYSWEGCGVYGRFENERAQTRGNKSHYFQKKLDNPIYQHGKARLTNM